jgi:OmpA-OmpF porin, OOP family
MEIKLGGYTDNTGDSVNNVKLSQQRAEAAKAELVSRGIDAKRLSAEGYGPMHPVADNATEEGRARNRRIDVRVTKK